MSSATIKAGLGPGTWKRRSKIGTGPKTVRTFEDMDTGRLVRTNDEGEILTHCLQGYYFSFGEDYVVITPAGLWERERRFDDTSSADHFLPPGFFQLAESVYETTLPLEEARAILIQCGAEEHALTITE